MSHRRAGAAARPVLLALLLLCPARALAQSDDAYRDRVQEAVVEFDAHRFEEARALFRQAHALSPSARTLRGIGLASFEMGDYPEAFRALEASLVDARRPLTEEQRVVVTDVLERTRRFVGLYTVEAPGATLTVDGAPPTRAADGRLVLPLGSHVVAAHAADHEPASATVAVNGGEQTTLSLSPMPIAAPPPVEVAGPGPSPLPSSPPAPSPPPPQSPDVTAPVVTLVLGGTVAAAAIVTGVAWWLPRDQETDRCVDAGADCFNLPELEGARDAAAGTTVAAALLGAAGLVAGAVWLASLGDEASEIACAPVGLGVACAGGF